MVVRAYSGPARDASELSAIRSLPLCEDPSDGSGNCRPGHPEGKVLPQQHLHTVVVLAIDGRPVDVTRDGKTESAIELDGSYVVHVLPGKHTFSVARVDVARGETIRVAITVGTVRSGMADVQQVSQIGDKVELPVELEAGRTYEFAEWTGAIATGNGWLFPDPPANPPLAMPDP